MYNLTCNITFNILFLNVPLLSDVRESNVFYRALNRYENHRSGDAVQKYDNE